MVFYIDLSFLSLLCIGDTDPHASLRRWGVEITPGIESYILYNFAPPLREESDSGYVVARASSVGNEDLQRAFGPLYWTPQFVEWLFFKQSSKLLVIGDFGEITTSDTPGNEEKISAMSVLCANMYTTLNPQRGVYCLYFCCGLHRNLSSPGSGGKGLIKSFLRQLLGQHLFVRGRVTKESLDKATVDDDLPALCDLFFGFVRQLPEDSILFCLIDGAENYEDQNFQNDFAMVVARLQGMVEQDLDRSQPLFCCMKLLLAFARTEVPEYIGFTGRDWIKWN